MFKTETHLHTRESSPCSHEKAIKMVDYYKEAGFSTVFTSDHISRRIFDNYGDVPWKDKVTMFMAGYYRARHRGLTIGVNVLFSVELEVRNEYRNHYLLYNVTREFLEEHECILYMSIEELYPLFKEHDIYVVQAHPARPTSIPTPHCVDAFEVYNGKLADEYNAEALELAVKYDLPQTAGADAHKLEHIGQAAVLSEYEIKTSQDYINLLKNKQAVIYRRPKEPLTEGE